MTAAGGPEDDAAAPGGRDADVVRAAYTSSREILEREATALLEEYRSRPGFWTGFWVGRLRRFALHVVAVAVVWLSLPSVRVVLAASLVALVSFATWTAVAARRAVRLMWEQLLEHLENGCPAGTPVSATYSADRFEFTTPRLTYSVDPATFLAARVRNGVVLLDQAGEEAPWVVPDELLGAEGHALLRSVFGGRYVAA